MSNISHQGQCSTRDCAGVALVITIPNVRVHPSGHGLAIFQERCFQGATEDAADVAIDPALVFSIHGRHRILHVQDGRQSALCCNVLDAAQSGLANGMTPVNLQDQIEAVVLQKDSALIWDTGGRRGAKLLGVGSRIWWSQISLGTNEEGGSPQAGGRPILQQELQSLHRADIFGPDSTHLRPLAPSQRCDLIQKAIGEVNHSFTSHGIVSSPLRGIDFHSTACHSVGWNHIKAVERIIQGSPAGIHSVQHIASIV
mmetsp:Transcript_87333/g.138596  ORF Transcript_87333/g.138596 Transcript_87333/m.138596 type:complete len:256 (+) Transcript_87333:1408-2175(+)